MCVCLCECLKKNTTHTTHLGPFFFGHPRMGYESEYANMVPIPGSDGCVFPPLKGWTRPLCFDGRCLWVRWTGSAARPWSHSPSPSHPTIPGARGGSFFWEKSTPAVQATPDERLWAAAEIQRSGGALTNLPRVLCTKCCFFLHTVGISSPHVCALFSESRIFFETKNIRLF